MRNGYLAKRHADHPLPAASDFTLDEQTEIYSLPEEYSDGVPHQANFFEAVRPRRRPVENEEFGNGAAIGCHLANYSYFKRRAAVGSRGQKDNRVMVLPWFERYIGESEFLIPAIAEKKEKNLLMDRRTLLSMISTTALARTVGRNFAWAEEPHRIKTIGIQLYTVRDALKQDYDGTLAKLAAIGYREVESGKDHDISPPKAMREALMRHGLTSPSSHVDWGSLGVNWTKVIEENKIVGRTYLVNPWIDETVRNMPDGWKHAAETLNRAGETSKKAGIQLAYHNHWIEFVPSADGKLPYDILLENLDPNLVKMEMDLGWITVGGHDPVKYFERYPGRFVMVHVKDVHEVPDTSSLRAARFAGENMTILADVGKGIIDWKRIFAHSEQAGIRHYFVEHDDPKDSIDTARVSYEYLERLRF